MNPTRIDRATNPGRTLGRRPIVLARLPHVGIEPSVESGEPRAESQEVYFPPAPTPELESSREEPSKRSRSRRHKKHVSESRESPPNETFQQQHPPTRLSATLFTLHSQLAPMAGAIVALALIASAGLLYWMIVSPGQMPTDFRDTVQEGFEANTALLPKFSAQLPSFASRTHTATTGIPETTAFEMPRWDSDEGATELSSATLEETQLQEEELVVTLEEPAAKPTSVNAPEQMASPAEGPAFPTTNRPTALDFAKLGAEVQRR